MTLPEKLRDVRVSIGLEWDSRHRQYVFDTVSDAAKRIEELETALRKVLESETKLHMRDIARKALSERA